MFSFHQNNKSTSHTSWLRIGHDPKIDWFIILSIGMAISLVFIVIGVNIYFSLGKRLKSSTSTLVSKRVISQEEVLNFLKIIEQKKNIYENITPNSHSTKTIN